MDIITRKEAKAQGLPRYFTGKPCKHGHISERYTSGGNCIECHEQHECRTSEYKKEHYQQNKERILARNAQWREANPEIVKALNAAHYKANKQECIERAVRWNKENPERRSIITKKHRDSNPEDPKERARRNSEWYARNYKQNESFMRRLKLNAIDQKAKRRQIVKDQKPLTPAEKAQVASIYTLRDVLTAETGVVHHVDHHIPLSKGGLHHPSNLWVITAAENLRKNSKMPEELSA